MNITLTKDELSSLVAGLQTWYNNMNTHVLTELMKYQRDDFMRMKLDEGARPTALVWRLRDEYEKANPKPDWRTLL